VAILGALVIIAVALVLATTASICLIRFSDSPRTRKPAGISKRVSVDSGGNSEPAAGMTVSPDSSPAMIRQRLSSARLLEKDGRNSRKLCRLIERFERALRA